MPFLARCSVTRTSLIGAASMMIHSYELPPDLLLAICVRSGSTNVYFSAYSHMRSVRVQRRHDGLASSHCAHSQPSIRQILIRARYLYLDFASPTRTAPGRSRNAHHCSKHILGLRIGFCSSFAYIKLQCAAPGGFKKCLEIWWA